MKTTAVRQYLLERRTLKLLLLTCFWFSANAMAEAVEAVKVAAEVVKGRISETAAAFALVVPWAVGATMQDPA
jgi:hypothetical protein